LFQHAALPHDLFLRLYDPEPTEIHTLSLHDALPIFTMLAEHRLVYHGYVLHVIQVPDFIFLRIGLAVLFDRIIPVDTYPMHFPRSEEHTSELQSRENLVCRLLLEKKKQIELDEPTTS